MVYTSLMRTYQLPICFLVFDWCKVSGKACSIFISWGDCPRMATAKSIHLVQKTQHLSWACAVLRRYYLLHSFLGLYTIGHLSDAIERLLLGPGIGHRG